MSSMGNISLTEQIACETAIIMLESPAQDKVYGTPEAWDYMETYFCSEDDLQAWVHYLKCKAQALARLGSEFIKEGLLGSEDFLALL